jgi:hypothetical protein
MNRVSEKGNKKVGGRKDSKTRSGFATRAWSGCGGWRGILLGLSESLAAQHGAEVFPFRLKTLAEALPPKAVLEGHHPGVGGEHEGGYPENSGKDAHGGFSV